MHRESFELENYRTSLVFGPYQPREASADTLWIADGFSAGLRRLPPGRLVVLAAGEAAKSWASVEKALARALELGLGRDGVFTGIGGGVVCDLTAFAASIHMRGAGLELVPTTLLAMVDASFGGKTGINLGGFKNMAGSFYPARLIHIDTGFLSTLSDAEYSSGLAEVIKAGLLGEPDLLRLLEDSAAQVRSREPAVVDEIVRRALLFKAGVVTRDLRENGERAFLNLGHTFGHGLEAAAGMGRISHGQAVAWGIRRALDAGLRLGATDPGWAARANRLLDLYGYPVLAPVADADALLAAILHDKKKRSGRTRFVLQRSGGDNFLSELDDRLVREVIRAGLD
jgi:3-dehydroquinate synthase